MKKYKYNICCFVNDIPTSQSGPNKSLNLMFKKVFKKKKNIFLFFKFKNSFFMNNKKFGILDVFKFLNKSKIIYLNGVYSFSHFLFPLIIAIYVKPKIIISPRGMLGEEAFVKSKYKKLIYLFFLNFFLKLFKKKDIIFHATSIKEKVDIKNIIKCDPKSIKMIPNLNITNIKFLKKNKKKNLAKFFYFSNITSKKNLGTFIEAMKKTGIKSKNMSLDVYGKVIERKYYNYLKFLIKTNNLNVFFKNEIPNDEVQKIQKNYHFLAHPSHGENYGHTIVECLSAGIPSIISDNTPWSDYDSNFDGLVHPSILPDQLSRSLKFFYSMNNKKYQMLKKSSYTYFKKFILSNESKNIKLYNNLFS